MEALTHQLSSRTLIMQSSVAVQVSFLCFNDWNSFLDSQILQFATCDVHCDARTRTLFGKKRFVQPLGGRPWYWPSVRVGGTRPAQRLQGLSGVGDGVESPPSPTPLKALPAPKLPREQAG